MGKVPSFVTGANAKVKIGGITLAYAQDVSYNTTVTTIPIETLGRYEVVSNEPVAYFVDGTLSVIRYTKIAQENTMAGTAAGGNGLGKWILTTNANQDASAGMNPSTLLKSQTFDLEIFQKTVTSTGAASSEKVIKIMGARFTRKGGGINKRGILVDQYAFNAILAEDDSFTAAGSGDEDLGP